MQEYKTSESPQSFVKMEAIKIFQTYLGPNAPLSVQALATKQSSEFLVKIQRDSHVSRNIFDDLVEKVLNDLGAREFRDYTQSKQFRHLQLTLHAPIPTLNELVDYEYDEKILELVNSTLRNRISLLSLRNDPESSEWDMDFNSSIPRGKNGRNMTGSLQFQSSLDDVSRRRNQKLFTSNI